MAEGKMHIIYLGEYAGIVGGIERYALNTAILLREAGYEVDYAYNQPARDAEIFRQGFNSLMTYDELFASKQEYALAILHKIPTPDTLKKLRQRFQEKLLFWAHDHDLYCPRHHYYTPFGRTNCHRTFSTLRCAACSMCTHPRNWKTLSPLRNAALLNELRNHKSIVLSQYMAENLRKNHFSDISIIHPFAEPQATSKTFSASKLNILFVGQLICGKGCDLLLDAMSQVKRDFHLTIAGDGNSKSQLEAQTRQLNLQDKVTFTGWLSDTSECYAKADLAVFPSRWQEPFGLCGLEAMSNGLPVVAFNVGGVSEWLTNNVTGIAVPDRDTTAFANAIDSLTPEMMHDFSVNALNAVSERFSKQAFLNAFAELI